MKKIALTGFENFGNNKENVTEILTRDIAKKYKWVNTLILPVSYNRCYENISSLEGEVLIHLGLASSRDKISLERCAYNKRSAFLPDNDGATYNDEKILYSGNNIVETTLKGELNDLEDKLNTSHIPCYISTDPGRFVCNNIYYMSLSKEKRPVLFIHFPPFEKMEKDTEEKALNIILNYFKEKYLD